MMPKSHAVGVNMTIAKSEVLMAATGVLSTRVLTLDAAARDGESHG